MNKLCRLFAQGMSPMAYVWGVCTVDCASKSGSRFVECSILYFIEKKTHGIYSKTLKIYGLVSSICSRGSVGADVFPSKMAIFVKDSSLDRCSV